MFNHEIALLVTVSSKLLHNHCATLEVAWTKSYIHGLFESLQNGYFIHNKDIDVAMILCQKFQVDVDLTEFITVSKIMKKLQDKKV